MQRGGLAPGQGWLAAPTVAIPTRCTWKGCRRGFQPQRAPRARAGRRPQTEAHVLWGPIVSSRVCVFQPRVLSIPSGAGVTGRWEVPSLGHGGLLLTPPLCLGSALASE